MINGLSMYVNQTIQFWNEKASVIDKKIHHSMRRLWKRHNHPGLDLDALIHTTVTDYCTDHCYPGGDLERFKVLEPHVSATGRVVLSDWCTCPSRRLLCTDLVASVSP
jgi:hypothetical protein